jgi:large subunit ribosomal protein L6
MSRVGMKPIQLPKGVTVNLAGAKIAVKGPKGSLEMARHPLIDVVDQKGLVQCNRKQESREARAAHGLIRALLANMVKGVSEGFERSLEINGVGYRAEVKGKSITFALGYSHPINFPLPDGITAKMDKNVLTLTGFDKGLLGQTAANIRALRPPEPYKGKGVKYVEERILRKVGKAAG